MTNLNSNKEVNPTTTKVSKVAVEAATNPSPSQVADTETRVATPKDMVEEINVFPLIH